MAEHEKDAQLSQRYRDLGRDEPPRHLDDAILAASRREVRRKPWLYPVAAAAALGVLAVAVSLHVEREQPEEIVAMKDAAPAPAPAPAAPEPPRAVQRAEKAPAPLRREAPAPVFVPDPKPPAEKPSADSAGPGAMADRRNGTRDLAKQSGAGSAAAEQMPESRAARPQSAPPPAAASPRMREAERPLAALGLDEAPLPWLERIARLREESKHEEADRALAEFRKRYPDFKISDEMLRRVEKK